MNKILFQIIERDLDNNDFIIYQWLGALIFINKESNILFIVDKSDESKKKTTSTCTLNNFFAFIAYQKINKKENSNVSKYFFNNILTAREELKKKIKELIPF